VSCHAKVAWHKRNLFRSIETQGKWGPQKELFAGRNTTHCAKVAWCKGRIHEGLSVKQEQQMNKTRKRITRGTRIRQLLGRRQLMRHEGTNGPKNLDIKEQLCPGNERTTSGIYKKTIRLEIMKQTVGISSGL
jgi:hypothetical protein